MTKRDDLTPSGEGSASRLEAVYGREVELTDEQGGLASYRILAELSVEGRDYAILQSERLRAEGEIEVFRLSEADAEELQLETVSDDDEWEAVAEAYDDLQFGSDDRP